MNITVAVFLIIILAIAAANVPFVNERLFGFIPLTQARKSLWLRLFELIIMYVLVGIVAYFIERHFGDVFTQDWIFFTVSICVFIIFAYPGFVVRYLLR